MTYKFNITEGCPKTGHDIACNQTQYAPAFSTNIPSVAERAKDGMAAHKEYRANESDFRKAKEAEKKQSQPKPKRFLKHEEIQG